MTASRARTPTARTSAAASLSFDSEGSLYIGTGDDVDPFGAGGNGYAPMDQRYPERYDARNTSANTNDLRGKILRIKPLANAAGAAGAGTTYSIPAGNMFAPGTEKTKPEIFAMGFRNPFTVAADPAHPGTVVVGDYGPDAATNSATRGPAGIIEWNRVTKPGFYGWPLCAGDNSAANSYFRYTFPSGPSGARFDCAAAQIPNESPNNSGLTEHPGPGRRRRRVAQAHGRPSGALRDPDPLEPAGVDHRADLQVRRRQPVDDQVAGLLRRRLVHPRPRAELVARGARARTTAPACCA